MPKPTPLDLSQNIDILSDWQIHQRPRNPGAPTRINGMTMGFVTMQQSAPHNGEMHPDGDELLYVISGKISVVCDSAPDEPLVLGPGEGCIVPAGEWHKVDVVEPAQIIHMTPGPGGDHRPLRS
ncbi:MAG: cupin domain-containing protein [Pseudomonadota bacterium]